MLEFDVSGLPELPIRKKRFSFIKILHEWIIPFGIEILAVIAIIKFLFFFAFLIWDLLSVRSFPSFNSPYIFFMQQFHCITVYLRLKGEF